MYCCNISGLHKPRRQVVQVTKFFKTAAAAIYDAAVGTDSTTTTTTT